MSVNNKDNSRRGNIYNDKVLVGNWYEERLDGYMPLQDGNKDSEYQREYRARVLPKKDESTLWKTRIRALGLPIMLIREHGIRGGYRNNLSSLYDLNCAIAYHERPERRFNTVANTFVPEQDFTADHGPGRNDLIGRKLAAWAEDKRITDGVDPATEYQCCFTSQNG
ncbi:uncharacterized protein LOC126834964 [Adelges cooleyi]|uniref:uncharacterized protein LOC126834964 n=1 Tax=Adelges cooleyi TaxID=133065 RepID=UPI0021802149|nr:uncharacterized protein LOC126834964 [Adelges cooleyi]